MEPVLRKYEIQWFASKIVKDLNTQQCEKNGHKAEVLKPIRTRRHLAGLETAAATTSRIRIQSPADPLGQAASRTPAPPGLSFSGFPVADTNEEAPAQRRRGLEWLVAGAKFGNYLPPSPGRCVSNANDRHTSGGDGAG